MRRGKKYIESAKQVDRLTQYDSDEAFKLITDISKANFDETRRASCQAWRRFPAMPTNRSGARCTAHGTGKKVRVLVFAKNEKARGSRGRRR